ncbi:LexA family transcriptional regulator [Buttiauxella sp. B2]|uniref:LexA family protein n=1 Tax=Buttiauxella sp. B2 TaxID=2587812 RepID=UPI0011230E26|nr:LexA family transcriptional regulator [Buttiauxella sp. B2]TNV14928.1 LexA family transcriptional regulator [Buttiauxella sp. B2]
MKQLTPRQQEVLAFITNHQNSIGFPPTNSEIAYAMEFHSPNAATFHLKALQRKGYITMIPGKARGIQLNGTQSPVAQRDEALTVLRELLACSVDSAERAAALLKRYDLKEETV